MDTITMINNNMNNQQNKKPAEDKTEKRPNELGGFYFSSHLKIHDPNTKEVLVKLRGDQ
jgi:hypothetical protein